ncbi:MAG: hypothetical protein KDH93_21275 [Rhodoferax sp.]|nr:hypothetical protein [Rhodoferax sp.]MCP5263659.1 hypothetical protein [Rhodoferax sp.]
MIETVKALNLEQIETEAHRLFERIMMLQELANLAIARVPNYIDQEIIELQGLLTGMREMLCNDGGRAHHLSESISTLVAAAKGKE